MMMLRISRNLPSWRPASKENSQIIIIQIREPKRILEAFEEELKELADILPNENS
jgi:hypothetical protein